MAPSKKRTGTGRGTAVASRSAHECPCLSHRNASGICDLHVWQGTTIEAGETPSGHRLLRPHLPVVKYKEFGLDSLSGSMYLLILLNWAPLLLLFVAIYIFVVGIFALFFAACNVNFAPSTAQPRDYFNLSLQTMATIGYGVLFPKDSCSNWVAVVESFVSMIVIALMTGVAFVKFARPHPHIMFSKVFTISPSEHTSGLEMRFRVVNGTRRELIMKSEILEVSFKLLLMRIEETRTGERKLCYYDLHLKTTSYITLRLEAEIVHTIDSCSPFFGMTEEDWARADFLIILMMSGVDETLHDMVHQQFEYSHEHLRWGEKFVSILTWDHRANRIDLDFDHISATQPSPIDSLHLQHSDGAAREETNDTVLSTETQGNGEILDELRSSLENIAFDDTPVGDNEQPESPMGQRVSPKYQTQITGVDYTDLESVRSYQPEASEYNRQATSGGQESVESPAMGEHELDDDGDGEKSIVSIGTNSGSENDERHEATPIHHIRFDHRSRTTSLRLPRLRHRTSGSGGTRRQHAHDRHEDLHEQPMSLLRRRVRFKNHPLSRFSKGLYYRALETSWWRLFLYMAFVYFAAIAVIAGLIHLSSPQAVVGAADVKMVNTYEKIFFFCGQTLSTIGYGSLSPNPQSDLVNFYVFLLAVLGTGVSTLVTGLAWAKFSIPKASTVLFSDFLLLTDFHSHRAIMFRAANSRTFGAIVEGSFRVSVVILNQRLGHKETHELKLVRNVWPVVQLGTTVTHIIDQDSPLYDISTDDLLSGHHFFVVLFTGFDPVVTESMFSRKTYHSCDILVGHHFVDNIKLTHDGVHIDLEAINDTTLTPDIDRLEPRLDIAVAAIPTESSSAIALNRLTASVIQYHELHPPSPRSSDGIDIDAEMSPQSTKFVQMHD